MLSISFLFWLGTCFQDSGHEAPAELGSARQAINCSVPVVSYSGHESKLFEQLLDVIHRELGREIESLEVATAFKQRWQSLETKHYCDRCIGLIRSLAITIESDTQIRYDTPHWTQTMRLRSASKTARKLVNTITREPSWDSDHTRQLVWFIWFESVLDCLGSPYNYYIYADQLRSSQLRSRGKLFMPGFTVDIDNQSWIIAEIFDPHIQTAGVSAGAQVISFNHQQPHDSLSDYWAQESPFDYHLVVSERGRKITISASAIPLRIPTISWSRFGEFGYARFSGFSNDTLIELRRLNRRVSLDDFDGLIIDLRDNPGGTSSSGLVDCFLKPGQIVMSYQMSDDEAIQHVSASVEYVSTPLVVLVDRNSASMSEVFAAAIKTANRGVLIGEQTFGKCVGQTQYPIADEGALGLVKTRYFFPDTHESWCDSGIEPEHWVNIDELTRQEIQQYFDSPQSSIEDQLKIDPVLNRAITYLREGK